MSYMCVDWLDTWLAEIYPYLTERKIGVYIKKCANLG
jgi:hypothetical protein